MSYESTLHALADPTRRAILERLRDDPRAVGELAAELPVTRPAVSQHLKVLKEAGLVSERQEGTRRIYSVESGGLDSLRQYLESFWGDVLRSFESAAQEKGSKSHGE